MWFLLLPVLLQTAQPAPAALRQRILEWDPAKSAPDVLTGALASADTSVQQLALRALGRHHLAEGKADVLSLLRSPSAAVRQEAANTLGELDVTADYAALLQQESNGDVRAALYETLGRITPSPAGSQGTLAAGLADAHAAARLGAARGLESFVRVNRRSQPPTPETLASVRSAFRTNTASPVRELLLLVLNAAGDKDSATFAAALSDTSAGVRRLAVLGTKRWVADASPSVRYEALRAANSCERALGALTDASETVMLAAIDMLGERTCDARPLDRVVKAGANWRIRAHALVALARTSPDQARTLLPAFASDRLWHTRAYAATAARVLGDMAVLRTLARDPQPNVAMEAMTTAADAINALNRTHSGLLLTAANKLKGTPELPGAMPQVVAALQRLARERRATTTDARVALMERIGEAGSSADANTLVEAMADLLPGPFQRAVALRAAKGGAPGTQQPAIPAYPPVPSAEAQARYRGATARIAMKGLGTITVQLLADEAPLTVYTFATLAEKGAYNGLTFHRIVPNFVIQGGSPGADEYDGLTDKFMRDEVGRTSHLRGTLGISTRGADTGDGQIFVNLVNNFRLDHAYTVFARVTSGMDIVDRVGEGDVIERVTIVRKP